MIKKLYHYFKSLLERKPESTEPIEPVFSIAGKVYYRYKDISKVKNQRALTTNDFYNELYMHATRDFLIKHCEAMDTVLTNNTKIDIGKLFKLNQQLQERLEMIYEVDIIYKVASVVFFTKDESPLDYDDLLGREKIALFKQQDKDDPKMGFFFGTLFKNLIGATEISDKDLLVYMTVGKQITTEHLKTISTILSKKTAMTA